MLSGGNLIFTGGKKKKSAFWQQVSDCWCFRWPPEHGEFNDWGNKMLSSTNRRGHSKHDHSKKTTVCRKQSCTIHPFTVQTLTQHSNEPFTWFKAHLSLWACLSLNCTAGNNYAGDYNVCFADIVQPQHKKAHCQSLKAQEHTSEGRGTLDQPGWNHQTEFSGLFVKHSSCYYLCIFRSSPSMLRM